MLVNVKIDISGSKIIMFKDYKCQCYCSFLMAQLKLDGTLTGGTVSAAEPSGPNKSAIFEFSVGSGGVSLPAQL